MGWKLVKEEYDIGHAVQVDNRGICIGSPYISDIIVIGLDGVVKKRYDDGRTNDDLLRYQSDFDNDPEKLKWLVLAKDSFRISIPVFTYRDGVVIKKHCEVLGWPNVTHDGEMMYENTFFSIKVDAIKAAKKSESSSITWAKQARDDAKKEVVNRQMILNKNIACLVKLNTDYPDVIIETGGDE